MYMYIALYRDECMYVITHFTRCCNVYYYFYSLIHNQLTDESVEVFCDLITTHKSLSFLWLVYIIPTWCVLNGLETRVNNREEESVEYAFGPSINCSVSNVTFAKAHVMYSWELVSAKEWKRIAASLASVALVSITLVLGSAIPHTLGNNSPYSIW